MLITRPGLIPMHLTNGLLPRLSPCLESLAYAIYCEEHYNEYRQTQTMGAQGRVYRKGTESLWPLWIPKWVPQPKTLQTLSAGFLWRLYYVVVIGSITGHWWSVPVPSADTKRGAENSNPLIMWLVPLATSPLPEAIKEASAIISLACKNILKTSRLERL